MTTASTSANPNQIDSVYEEIEVVWKRLYKLQNQIEAIPQEKKQAETYRDGLLCAIKAALLDHEYAALSLRLYDLLENVEHRKNERNRLGFF